LQNTGFTSGNESKPKLEGSANSICDQHFSRG
jgi:hypothetical protein